jgi:hypothetical protein
VGRSGLATGQGAYGRSTSVGDRLQRAAIDSVIGLTAAEMTAKGHSSLAVSLLAEGWKGANVTSKGGVCGKICRRNDPLSK